MKTIVLTGGGTAGHVIPNIALIPHLKEAGYSIHYIGSKEGIERELIEGMEGITYHAIASGKLRRYVSAKNFTDPFRIMAGTAQAIALIRRIKPSVLFSKGGFVAVPVVFAAKTCGVPVVIHESDITPGLANRLSRPFAKVMCTTFEQAAKVAGEKGVVTGSPVRPEILKGNAERGLALCGFKKGRPVLLVMGGSSGATALNEAIDQNIDKLTRHYQIIHIRGGDHLSPKLEGTEGYRQFGYIKDELPDILAAADVVLSRAGANAIFEFAALHKPMLLIPLPLSASRGDQIKNAKYFQEKGWARVLDQEKMDAQTLFDELLKTYEERGRLSQNLADANAENGLMRLFEEIMKAAK